MTRSEKRAAADIQRREWIYEWASSMQTKLKEGKPFPVAAEETSKGVTRLIEKFPHRKSEIIHAWSQLFREIREAAKQTEE